MENRSKLNPQLHQCSTDEIDSNIQNNVNTPPIEWYSAAVNVEHKSQSEKIEDHSSVHKKCLISANDAKPSSIVVLVNEHKSPTDPELQPLTISNIKAAENLEPISASPNKENDETLCLTQQTVRSSGRNSLSESQSLRKTLQQLPSNVTVHRHRRHYSPKTQSNRTADTSSSIQEGIIGFVSREQKQQLLTTSAHSILDSGGATRKLQSFSDPQASPAQRSLRCRNNFDKSPRRKRSKSESRRRRERKLIAAGEIEVRQANETLMRYLKQCSEMNDASLSGELEIDKNIDERKINRKSESQRSRRGRLLSKIYTAGGLSSIMKELSDDIVSSEKEDIYNPFTPIVSPTDDIPAHLSKMFLQTSSGYRPVEHFYNKCSFDGVYGERIGRNGTIRRNNDCFEGSNNNLSGLSCLKTSDNINTRPPFDVDKTEYEITTCIQLACVIQQIWLLIANVCHGLLAGLALAHLLFVLGTMHMDWSNTISQLNIIEETAHIKGFHILSNDDGSSNRSTIFSNTENTKAVLIIGDYAAFADIYLNTFYCLAIPCLISIFDRMDIYQWSLHNASGLISFRMVVIAMIYTATIVLTICGIFNDEKLLNINNSNATHKPEQLISSRIMCVHSSLSITRSIAAICGWVMIGLKPYFDLLYEDLVNLTRHELKITFTYRDNT
ncbi:uncharacterized protein LOC119673521 [Teleopsis dalmanni]|uniref:uncharacterized protein LOC119673521 n=1 Tax=Teleopsis dalmanni TaxID=139649 RepID=UPI0018CED5D7|nr:uncharacterized protein LOC119673521 [Teleopsis dalmanni]